MTDDHSLLLRVPRRRRVLLVLLLAALLLFRLPGATRAQENTQPTATQKINPPTNPPTSPPDTPPPTEPAYDSTHTAAHRSRADDSAAGPAHHSRSITHRTTGAHFASADAGAALASH